MTDSEREAREHNGTRRLASRRNALVLAVVLLVAVGAILTTVNRERLSVHSDIGMPPPEQTVPPELAHVGPPEILSLTAATDRVQPFDLCDIVCEAIHPDGHDLTYEWSVSAGSIFGEGPRVEWGSPISEGLYKVSVTVRDDRGLSAEQSMSLRVKANAPPRILSIEADADWLSAGESARFWCVALDPDGDAFTYEWSATGGEIFGQGSSIIWLAPDDIDSYWITVTVTDAYGGEARRALPVSVTPFDPPQIREMIVEPLDTSMFKRHGDSWTIYQGRSCTIQCVVAEGNGPFTYEWSADYGTITNDGSVVTWEAPKSVVGATVVVVVTDADGNRSTSSALIYVETCTCSF